MFGGPPPPPTAEELLEQEETASQTLLKASITCVLLYISPYAISYARNLI